MSNAEDNGLGWSGSVPETMLKGYPKVFLPQGYPIPSHFQFTLRCSNPVGMLSAKEQKRLENEKQINSGSSNAVCCLNFSQGTVLPGNDSVLYPCGSLLGDPSSSWGWVAPRGPLQQPVPSTSPCSLLPSLCCLFNEFALHGGLNLEQ